MGFISIDGNFMKTSASHASLGCTASVGSPLWVFSILLSALSDADVHTLTSLIVSCCEIFLLSLNAMPCGLWCIHVTYPGSQYPGSR